MNKAIASNRYLNLVEWLKRSREKNGQTMRALAEKLDVPHSFVQKIESLERRLDTYEYVQYCEGLGVDPCVGIKKFLQQDKELETDSKSDAIK